MTKSASKSRRVMNRAAAAAPGGKSTAELVRQSNRWRDNYNALRGLVISKVVSLIEAAQRGDFAELELVLKRMERRFPVLKALKARRLAALEKLDWNIKTVEPLPAGVSESQAEAQQQFLRSRYDLIENLTDTFGQLVMAEFRGFAILQKHRYDEGENDVAVREFHWLPQYTWSRDGEFGDWFYNRDSRFGVGGDACRASLGEENRIGSEQLPRSDFVIREHDTPLYEIELIAFVNWAMGRKDWAAFVEVFGLPNAIVIMPPNIPSGKETEYLSAAEKVADGVSGALPSGSDAKFPTASVRSQAPFKEFCDANVEDVVLAGTGGLLTMLSQPTGIGQGASGEHGDAFDEIAQADARRINEVLQHDFDQPELAAEFPGQPHLVYFELCAREEEDVTETINQINTLKQAGYQVDAEQVEEKTGYEVEIVQPPAAPGFGAPQPAFGPRPAPAPMMKDAGEMDDATENDAEAADDEMVKNRDNPPASPEAALAAALAADLQPLRDRLARILAIEDPEIQRTKLTAFAAELDRLKPDILADPAAAGVLEQMNAQAFAKGIARS